ncbi:MAG: hypothetical protein AAGF67_05705 [Verrucomicrobiota bacterium]
MKAFVFLAALALVIPAVSQDSQDVIHLKTGESAACEIEAVTDNIVVFLLRGPAGGSAKRTMPMDRVDYIEFGFEEGEKAVFGNLDTIRAEILETWWDFHFAHLHRPRSRTAAYGVALGEALIRENPETGAVRALSIFNRIIERAWSEEDKALARQSRIRGLIASGDLDAAAGEAQILASRTEDPDSLIEVKRLLADADFERLKALEEEHPRWMEDDVVRPERNALYHGIVDQYLWPHLFHATREDAAARGLLAASEVYAFGNEKELARAALEDLTQLYPGTDSHATAVERLENFSEADSEE